MKAIFFLFIICLLCSCNNSKEEKKVVAESFTQKDRKRVIAEVKQTLDDYFASVKAKGLTGEFPYLDSTDDFYWIPPGYNERISYDSVASILNSRASFFTTIDNSIGDLKITPLSSEVASYSGKVRSAIRDTTGLNQIFWLIENGIMIKRKDGWKLLQGRTTLDRAGATYNEKDSL